MVRAPVTLATVDVTDVSNRMASVLTYVAAMPDMPGARCRNEVETFDAAAAGDPLAIDLAGRLCAQCPHLVPCQR